MLFNSAIKAFKSANSFFNFSTSRLVNLCKRISSIAVVCFSVNKNSSLNFFPASTLSADFLIIAITSSMFANAITKPSIICSFSSALSNSNCVLLKITSRWWRR